MEPTEAQLNARLAADPTRAGSITAPTSSPPAYSPSSFNAPAPTKVPTPQPATSTAALGAITGAGADSISALIERMNAPLEAEGTQNKLQTEFMKTLEQLSGKSERTAQLETQAGIPESSKRLQEILGQVQGINAEAQAEILKAESMGETLGFVRGEQGAIERQRAIRVLPMVATAQALQGNIALAQSNIDRAVQLEFEPMERRLDYLKQFYAFNQDNLARQDKKRSDQLNILIGERERVLAEQKTNREGVLGIMTGVAKYGAPQGVIDSISKAKTVEEAVRLAGPYMQDPRAKIELQNAILDTQLKKAQIKKSQYEFELLQKYGGMTPAQYAEYQKDERKRIADEKDATKKAELQGSALNEKLTLINGVLNSTAIDSVVGPTGLTRASTGGKFARLVAGTAAGATAGAFVGSTVPGLGTLVGAVLGGGAGLLAGTKDMFTGASDKLIGQVEQFSSQEFLDSVLAIKDKGGTLGALNEQEGGALRSATNYIASRAICSDGSKGVCGKGSYTIGYDMSEKDFKREMQRINTLTQKAYERATGSMFTPDEQAIFDAYDEAQNQTTFNPAF